LHNANRTSTFTLPHVSIRHIAAILLLFAVSMFFGWYVSRYLVEIVPPGIDWPLSYGAIENGYVSYAESKLEYAPWSLMFVMPLGLFPSDFAWGVYMFLVMLFAALSIPRQRPRGLVAMLIITTAFPTLRTAADGNFEAFTMMGIVLIAYSYPTQKIWPMVVGVLLASMKPQLSVFVILMLVSYMMKTWHLRAWATAAGIVLFFVAIHLVFLGETWITRISATANFAEVETQGVYYMNSSIAGTLERASATEGLAIAVRTAIALVTIGFLWVTRYDGSREKIGALIAAGLLVAPYAAGNSALSVAAIGVIPFFQRRLWPGIVLIALLNLPYLMLGSESLRFQLEPLYWTLYFMICWLVLMGSVVWDVSHEKRVQPRLVE
jgi:hypothetical protein